MKTNQITYQSYNRTRSLLRLIFPAVISIGFVACDRKTASPSPSSEAPKEPLNAKSEPPVISPSPEQIAEAVFQKLAQKPISELANSLVGEWRGQDEGGTVMVLGDDGTYSTKGTYPVTGKYTLKDDVITINPSGRNEYKQNVLLRGDTLYLVEPDSGTGFPTILRYQRMNSPSSAALQPSTRLPKLEELASSLAVSGTLSAELKKFSTFNQSGTRMEWKLDLALTNSTPHAFAMGNTLVVAQISTDGSPTGYLRVRGVDAFSASKPPVSPHVPYCLDDYDSTDGGRTIYMEGARFESEGNGKHPAHAGYGIVPPRAKREIVEFISPSVWLKQGAIQGIKIVLPDLIVETVGKERRRFHAVANLKKTSVDEEKSEWSADGIQIFSSEPDEVVKILADNDASLFRRILAMNWLVQSDPENAGRRITELTAGLNQGELLAVALRCCTQWNMPGFETRALQLEEAVDTPVGIAAAAGAYLDSRKTRRNWKKKVAEAEKKDQMDSTTASLSETSWVAVKIQINEAVVVRRFRAMLAGPASDEILSLHQDGKGLPGAKVADLVGHGGDARCKHGLSPGTYWLTAKRPPNQDRLGAWWPLAKSASPFTGYATSNNGGTTWVHGQAGLTAACEFWVE